MYFNVLFHFKSLLNYTKLISNESVELHFHDDLARIKDITNP